MQAPPPKPRQFRALRWASLWLGVVVLYVLSWTPVCCLNYVGDHAIIPVPWVDAFYKPVLYLYNETPLSSPLRAWEEFCLRLFPLDLSSNNPESPNHALQRTATLAFSYRCAAPSSTGSVTACAPATKPGTCRAFALRRCAVTRAPRSRSLSLGSLGVATRHL